MGTRDRRRIGGLIVVLAVLAAASWWFAADLPAYRVPSSLNWVVLALLSAAAERFVLHIQVRREAQAVSLSEIPLVLGLFLATPVDFGIGRTLGMLLACALLRRQAPVKVAFNAVQVAVESAVALLVFHSLLGAVGDGTPARWVAAVGASAVVGAVSAVSITAVVALAEGALHRRDLLFEPAQGALGSAVVAVPGLIGVALVEQSLWNGLLALLTLASLVVGYRAYAGLSERHLSLERLYRFSQVVSDRPEVDQVLQTILAQATEVLRADRAEVLFLPGEQDTHAVKVGVGADGRLSRTVGDVTGPGPWARAVRGGESVLITRDTRSFDDRVFLDGERLRDGIIVPLRGEAGLIGALMVADRVGEVRTFDGNDVRLLETVANHASVALRNGQLVDRLRYEAAHDALTGLPNRVALSRRLSELLPASAPGSAAVMLMDLDDFKNINDTLGHQHGDALLQHVAGQLTAAAPPEVFVSRLGGDEFAVVLPGPVDGDRAVAVAEVLLAAVRLPAIVDGVQLEVGASLGIALLPDHANDVPGLLRRADMAMYRAKNTHRGIGLFDPTAKLSESPAQLALVGELRHALIDGGLRLYVQPKADARTGEVVGVEALVRWEHPLHGLIMPDEFIPVAERNGLISELTTEMLRAAVTAVAAWERDGRHLSIAVNLSPRGLLGTNLPAQVAALLAEQRCGPDLLTLELTESSMMTDPVGVAALLADLHRMGVRLSIDDFGTGYSSMSSLRKLPLDEIKIDKSFVAGIVDNGDDEMIVRSIVDLGTNLGLDVVAEGVENERVWQVLRRMGCTLVQGYYLTRPIPVQEFPAWLVEYERLPARLPAAG
jgi:diguanylate cyclase (GGDEF)-like protein